MHELFLKELNEQEQMLEGGAVATQGVHLAKQ